jgi:hypothetical protein
MILVWTNHPFKGGDITKGVAKLVVLNGENFGYWKNRTRNYILSQGRAIWEIIREAYVIPAMLNKTTQGELQRYENNYKALNLTSRNCS